MTHTLATEHPIAAFIQFLLEGIIIGTSPIVILYVTGIMLTVLIRETAAAVLNLYDAWKERR